MPLYKHERRNKPPLFHYITRLISTTHLERQYTLRYAYLQKGGWCQWMYSSLCNMIIWNLANLFNNCSNCLFKYALFLLNYNDNEKEWTTTIWKETPFLFTALLKKQLLLFGNIRIKWVPWTTSCYLLRPR